MLVFPPHLLPARARARHLVFRTSRAIAAVYFHRAEESERETWPVREKKENGISAADHSREKMALPEPSLNILAARDFPVLFVEENAEENARYIRARE